MKTLFLIFLCFCTFLMNAQVNVFNKIISQIEHPRNIIRCGSNYLIAYSKGISDGYSIAVIDSNGFLINNNIYGETLEMEVLSFARKQSNSEILMMGHNFWDDSLQTNIGNYKAQVIVTDSMGIYKKTFRLKRNTTEFNRTYNGIFLEGSYYFSGEEHDSIMNGNTLNNIFLCKTDTSGNLLWYNSYPQFRGSVGFTMGLESTYDKSNILVGATSYDSVIGAIEHYSYLLMQIDTNGNFLNRLPVPELVSNLQYSGVNGISQISQIFTNKYLICGNREHYILDNQFSILDSIDMATIIHPADFGNKNLYDNSYTIGGGDGFSKMFNSNKMYTRDWSTLPNFVNIKDLIPTYDGGYIGIINNYFTPSRIIKTDCDGNYINPINCWPVGTKDYTTLDLHIKYSNHFFTFNSNSEQRAEAAIYDMQGRLLARFKIPKGISYAQTQNYPNGIYILKVTSNGKLIKTLKVLVE